MTPRLAGAGETDPQILRWDGNGWIGDAPASMPGAPSSFEAIDALIARLSDRTLFPALDHRAGRPLRRRPVRAALRGAGTWRGARRPGWDRAALRGRQPLLLQLLHPDRPVAGGGYAPVPADRCPRVDRWKYGMQALPAYAGDASPAGLERDYVRRRVTYLLGALDTDPELAALDASCDAEAQGATHLERGHDFFRTCRRDTPATSTRCCTTCPASATTPPAC